MTAASRLPSQQESGERIVARFVAWVLTFVPDRQLTLAQLAQFLFLLDWRLTQNGGRSLLGLQWQHDGKNVHALALRKQLERYPRLLLDEEVSHATARVRLGVREVEPPSSEVAATVEAYLRFLLGQSPGSLQRLCTDSFPVHSTVAGRPFTLEDRRAAYTRSRG